MRTFTFKSLFLTVLFVLLGSTAIQAAGGELITKQITLTLDEAGTLPDKISESQKNLITNLKIVGKINGTDLKFIREMAGCDVNGKETDGKLSILDLSDAKIVEGGSAYYSDRDDGFIYTSNDKLGDYVFNGCSGLTSLTLPSSVTKIGCYALFNCIGLTSLTLPSSVTEIGEHAFLNCSGLTNFTIPSGVTKIGASAFFCCYGLISLTIPSSVTAIGSQAFKHCSGLTSIYAYMEKLPETGSNLFLGCDEKNCTVYVPKGTGNAYFRSAEFGYFYNIVEFDATGIDKVATSADVKEVSRYSANGQRLSAPAKGLNIVKYSDGSVKKVVVQ
nr:leucine-rich repeat domain-containing protein [uncultured Prevotella sp.]